MKLTKSYLFGGKTVSDLFLNERVNDKTFKIDKDHNKRIIHQIYCSNLSQKIDFLNTKIDVLYQIFIEKKMEHHFQGFRTLTFYYEQF